MKRITVIAAAAIYLLLNAVLAKAQDTIPPYRVSSIPYDTMSAMTLNMPIQIKYSEKMNPSSLYYRVDPDPGSLGFYWSDDSLTVFITHANFIKPQIYQVFIDSVFDITGNKSISDSIKFSTLGTHRTIVAEDFTGTWCQYCPAAANGLDQLYSEAPDSLVVLGMHYGDAYQTTETYNRIVWYGAMIPGYPTVIFDGLDSMVGSSGSGATYSNYDYYRPIFDAHKIYTSSPFEMSLDLTIYDLSARTGTVTIKIKNIAQWTEIATFHFVVIERGIPYPAGWQGMYVLDFVVRDMVPDENGEAITIAAGDSLVLSRSYAIDAGWDIYKSQFVGFIQRSTKEIVQGAQLAGSYLVQKSYSLSEVGDGDGFNEPGESMDLWVSVHNLGGPSPVATVEATTADTFVTISNGLWNIGPIGTSYQGDNSGSPFSIVIKPSASMVEGHQVKVYITKKSFNSLYNDTLTAVDSVSFVVGSPAVLYSEDFESGLGNWLAGYTAWATGTNWDTTQADYHSASTCIVNSEFGDYANKQNRWIKMVNSLDLRNCSLAKLSWYEKYDVVSGDKCLPEVSTDSLGITWSSLVAYYSGSAGAWQKRELDISNYCGNRKFFRLRYRLLTDTINVAKGWYVDDIAIIGYTTTGVEGRPSEQPAPLSAKLFNCAPNPFREKVAISYQISSTQLVRLAVYDITGRLVKTLVSKNQAPGFYKLQWDGRNEKGQAAANGVYFYSLQAGNKALTKKLVLVK